MKEITAYQTKDGKQFLSKKQADGHQSNLIRSDLFKAFNKAVGNLRFVEGDRVSAQGSFINGVWTIQVLRVSENREFERGNL